MRLHSNYNDTHTKAQQKEGEIVELMTLPSSQHAFVRSGFFARMHTSQHSPDCHSFIVLQFSCRSMRSPSITLCCPHFRLLLWIAFLELSFFLSLSVESLSDDVNTENGTKLTGSDGKDKTTGRCARMSRLSRNLFGEV